MNNKSCLSKGTIERLGDAASSISYKINKTGEPIKNKLEIPIADHTEGLKKIVEILTDPENGVIKDTSEVDAVGHRVVHGGETYSGARLITDDVMAKVKELIPLAPLHNPANIQGIEVAEQFFPEAAQVAVFDTAFHQTMPAKSYRYPLPNELYEKEKIRAYGFHGSSHSYVSKQMLEALEKPVAETAIITIHLGNGCSMAAVKGGKCIDTSMGLSPLGGLMMGTRTGDIDPSIPFFLASKMGLDLQEIDKILNKQSGLKGITGSNDMRDVMELRANGDENAILAIDMYVQRIKKFIGAYAAEMGALDSIVFTAGIGENSDELRSLICDNMSFLGIELDESKNATRSDGNRPVHTENSKVGVWVIPTNEELEIAIQSEKVIKQEVAQDA